MSAPQGPQAPGPNLDINVHLPKAFSFLMRTLGSRVPALLVLSANNRRRIRRMHR